MTQTTTQIVLNAERNVTMTAMLQTVGGEFGAIHARPAVLIMPGGGYAMCSDREAECIAYPYLSAGYHAFVLRYSVGVHRKWPNPLQDYEQAMEWIAQNADQYHIPTDKIAVIGFSAGGHLAACAATVSQHRPAAAILVYPALDREIVTMCQPDTDVPIPIDEVDGDTCPCFLVAARDDTTVLIDGLLQFERRLFAYGTQFESHIYPYGGHGFGPGTACVYGSNLCSRIQQWQKDSIAWLESVLGRLEVSGMTKPVCLPHVNGDTEPMLSVFCTIAHLRTQPQAEPVVGKALAAVEQAVAERFGAGSAAGKVIEAMRLTEVLGMINIPAEQIDAMDDQLRNLKNNREMNV